MVGVPVCGAVLLPCGVCLPAAALFSPPTLLLVCLRLLLRALWLLLLGRLSTITSLLLLLLGLLSTRLLLSLLGLLSTLLRLLLLGLLSTLLRLFLLLGLLCVLLLLFGLLLLRFGLLLSTLLLLLLLLLGLLSTLLLGCTFLCLFAALSFVLCISGNYHSDKHKDRGCPGYSHEFHRHSLLSWRCTRTSTAKAVFRTTPCCKPRSAGFSFKFYGL